MKYKVAHTTRYTYSDAVPVCHNQVHLAPRVLPHQTRDNFQLFVSPNASDRGTRVDYFGNRVDYFSIQEPHLGLTVTANSNLTLSEKPITDPKSTPPWDEVTADLPKQSDTMSFASYQFVFNSRHVTRSPVFAEYARKSFSPGRPIMEACLELTARVHEEFTYEPKSTTVSTPVQQVFERRAGVCQDFAHLQIACLRSVGLAARYVSGYLRTEPPAGEPRLVGVDASHAWLSVFCGPAGWMDFDPTNNVIPGIDYLTVAWGRDYSDVCPIQGVFVGGGSHSMSVAVDVIPTDETV